MKNILLIFAGLITIGNVALSNGDIYDLPLSHCSYEYHKVLIPEEPKINNQEEPDINLIYSILLQNDSTKLRTCDSTEFSLLQSEEASDFAMIISLVGNNSMIEIEK